MNIQNRRRGRPRVRVAWLEVASLRDQGLSWRQIARELGIGKDTARNLLLGQGQKCPETLSKKSQEAFSLSG